MTRKRIPSLLSWNFPPFFFPFRRQETCRNLLDPHVPTIYSQVEDARGPREPWHDLHSKIDGPAAYDVLKNFEERWLKASKRSGAKKLSKLSRSHNDTLLWIEKIPDIIAIDDEIYSNDNDPERWDVQVSPAKGSINHCK